MKRCPQCGAEYDDYVQYCFVDGAELAAAAAGESAAAPPPPKPAPRASTPVPASGAPAPRPASPPPRHAPPPAEPARASTLWALLVLMLLGVALFAFVGLGAALLFLGNRDGTQPVVERPVPAPPPTALPPPNPTPRPASVLRVRFESTPPGAAVWEADRFLCTTPCDVEHPDYAPPQRTFVLKLDGFSDAEYVLTDPTVVQQVPLHADANHVPRPARPRPTDEILIQR